MRLRTVRSTPQLLRTAWWTFRAARKVRRDLAQAGLESVVLPRVPAGRTETERAIAVVLRRCGSTCLEGAVVRQQWHAAQGERRALVIGVTAPSEGFHAHAWLEGDSPCHDGEFCELLRRCPSS